MADLDRYPHIPAPGRTDTSVDAAASMEPVTARVQRLVLRAIRHSGSAGLTTNELSAALNMERTTVQPRTSELRRLGVILDSGKRRPNANGKQAIVWIAREVARG